MYVHLLFEPIISNGILYERVAGFTHSWKNWNNVVRKNVFRILRSDLYKLVEAVACKPVLCTPFDAEFASGNLYLKTTENSNQGIYKNKFLDKL